MNGKAPASRRNLGLAIERTFGDRESTLRVRRTTANVILGQMLPEGSIKGGSALMMRYGVESSCRRLTIWDLTYCSYERRGKNARVQRPARAGLIELSPVTEMVSNLVRDYICFDKGDFEDVLAEALVSP